MRLKWYRNNFIEPLSAICLKISNRIYTTVSKKYNSDRVYGGSQGFADRRHCYVRNI